MALFESAIGGSGGGSASAERGVVGTGVHAARDEHWFDESVSAGGQWLHGGMVKVGQGIAGKMASRYLRHFVSSLSNATVTSSKAQLTDYGITAEMLRQLRSAIWANLQEQGSVTLPGVCKIDLVEKQVARVRVQKGAVAKGAEPVNAFAARVRVKVTAARALRRHFERIYLRAGVVGDTLCWTHISDTEEQQAEPSTAEVTFDAAVPADVRKQFLTDLYSDIRERGEQVCVTPVSQ